MILEQVFIGVLGYPNIIRKKRMRAQWEAFGLEDHVWTYEGIDLKDCRVKEILVDEEGKIRPQADGVRRNFSITWGHLDMVKKFVHHTTWEYAIFCENDIVISRKLEQDVSWALDKMRSHELDIVLLGYLNCLAPDQYRDHYSVLVDSKDGDDEKRTLYHYPDDHWGVQMYMISRAYATRMLDTFTLDFVRRSWREEPGVPVFSPDHTISKLASKDKRAMLFPMAAIEDGTTSYDHGGQHNFHQASFHLYYSAERYFPPRMGDDDD